jgi:hypothetical protein
MKTARKAWTVDIDAAARRIAERALRHGHARAEAALFNAMMNNMSYKGMGEQEAVQVSNELYERWSTALRWEHENPRRNRG